MEENQTIDREALGRVATLGDLYDARYDKFSGLNIFKTKFPQDAIISSDNPSVETDFSTSDSLEDKLKKMEISGEISVSILSGMVEGKGSASYLSDKKDSARSVRCSMYYKSKTKTESLKLYSDGLDAAVAIHALQDTKATHVVAGISWGANATITFEYANTEKSDKQDIAGKFDAHFKKAPMDISGLGKGLSNESTSAKSSNFKIHTFADIAAPNEKIPSTPEEAQIFIQSMPTRVKEYNDGKGKPLTYKLIPISTVQKRFGIDSTVDRVLVSLDEQVLVDFIRLFDEFSKAKQRLFDLCSDIERHLFCVCEEDSRKADDADVGLKKTEAKFRSSFAKTLVEFRSGKVGGDALDELYSKNIEGPFSAKEINKLVDSFGGVTGKMSFADFLSNHGVTYIGRGTLFESEMRKNMKGFVYILFFGTDDMKMSKNWRKYQYYFTKLITQEKTDSQKVDEDNLETFLAVDLDLRKDIADQEGVAGGIRICKYKKGEIISHDLLTDERNEYKRIAGEIYKFLIDEGKH